MAGESKATAKKIAKALEENEINNSRELLEIELREEKSNAQRRMAWVAMVAMVAASVALYTPLVPIERVNALSGLLSGFYVAQAGIVAAYMGFTAMLGKKK